MKETEFHFKGRDGFSLYAIKWEPDNRAEPVGVVQIVHGMAEHIGRYRRFAEALTTSNFVVFGHDHRGHGQTSGQDDLIYFDDEGGWDKVVDDVNCLHEIIREDYPTLPCLLFGHSMGSFLSKCYIQRYASDLSGVILSGTGFMPKWLARISLWLAKRDVRKYGAKGLSQTLAPIVSQNYNKRFRPVRTESDWLSRDEAEVDRFVEDPLSGGKLTAGFYRDMLQGMSQMDDRQKCELIPHHLPILLVAGDSDPVGNFGKAIYKTKRNYEKAGLNQIDIKLYEGARHELLNELNREEVMLDLLKWMNKWV
ncbi:lysophospholipase [Pullulanibacillus sp. KACC 23026]|uniref:alpha/beta hydrolase n=1 Tax=Pullulanibacillus sp. KACC 23026 TaxID=3028315 RepID=UPI0023AEEA4A|nr:alpha/beta hydrolase [Pullulanibacillus sp. KACC 23026]WEG12553.1 lysophospholipase [Pullulanibacillus sp. KACC 23026]